MAFEVQALWPDGMHSARSAVVSGFNATAVDMVF
jgi:hypothetical protein